MNLRGSDSGILKVKRNNILKDPLMRRVEGSQIMPPGAVIHHRYVNIKNKKIFKFNTLFAFSTRLFDLKNPLFQISNREV